MSHYRIRIEVFTMCQCVLWSQIDICRNKKFDEEARLSTKTVI